MRHWIRVGASLAVLVTAAVASGCTSTVSGVAVGDPAAATDDLQPLRAPQLDDVLLTIAELNGMVGGTRMEIVLDNRVMSDNADAVSDPDCLGSIFSAENQVYRSAGWTDVRGQVAREPGDSNDHWVEQSVVLYRTSQAARDFVTRSTSAWGDCGGFSVAVNDDVTSSIWVIENVEVTDGVVTQVISQEDSNGWQCQHALTSVSNVSVETLACAFGINDEAVSMAGAIVSNVAKR